MDSKQLFEAGDLSGGINGLTAEIKSKPADLRLRTFLFELLCFTGELERAEKQLDVLAQQSPESEWATQVYTNLLEAERKRRRFYADCLVPEFLLDRPPYLDLHLQACRELAAGRPEESIALLERSEEERPAVNARLADGRMGPIRDADDLLAPVLEFMILRDYVWVPWEQLREVEIGAPERPRDLLWIPARLVLSDGSQRRGYLPTLYSGSHEHSDDRVKLGRMTDWRTPADGVGPLLASGQHTLQIGEVELGLLEIRKLMFT